MPTGQSRAGGIFISYRRQETSSPAGRLHDQLANRFGDDQVFMDVDTIELGADFVAAINRALDHCVVLLAVIGPQWLTTTDKDGRRRLDNPTDTVRMEVQTALDRELRVIPVLVEGAEMPGRQELPKPLAALADRNALTVHHDSFRYDIQRLAETIERAGVASPSPHPVGPRSPGAKTAPAQLPPACKARPILLPDTARYRQADKPGWWFASCEWRIPGESGATGNPAAGIMRAALRQTWHRRSIDAEPEMIQSHNDYLFIPFPPHQDSNPKDMPARVTLIDSNEQHHRYKVVFRISRLLEM